MHQHLDVIFGHDLFEGVHKGAIHQARGVIVVAHEAGHQGQVIGRLLTARIAERQNRHVQLATAHGVVLFPRRKQRLRRENRNLKVNVGGGDFVSHDLRHLVADVFCGPLVRQAQLGRGCSTSHEPETHSGGNQHIFHWNPPRNMPRFLSGLDRLSHAVFFKSIFLYTKSDCLRVIPYAMIYRTWINDAQIALQRPLSS